jgi:3alpha(or 20beta)-hydroxysteroid dehydrogenase
VIDPSADWAPAVPPDVVPTVPVKGHAVSVTCSPLVTVVEVVLDEDESLEQAAIGTNNATAAVAERSVRRSFTGLLGSGWFPQSRTEPTSQNQLPPPAIPEGARFPTLAGSPPYEGHYSEGEDMGRFDGKVVIVTGAARGQGEAEARLFAGEGAKVVLADVLDAEGQAVASDIGPNALYVHLDVSSESEWQSAIEATKAFGGRLDALVNNAAIIWPSAIEDTSLEAYMTVINVNQVGCFLGMKAAMPLMKDSGGGSIVNISSIDGIGSKNGLVSYTASKFAIRGMTKTAAMEWGRFGIRVNSVHPGGVNTVMGNPINDPILETMPYQQQAIQRIGYPNEIAAAVAFLASAEASYITGTELVVDGGWLTGRLEPGLPGSSATTEGFGYNA